MTIDERKLWLAVARASFKPGKRETCAVCGRYPSLTHAHHTVPLTVQYDLGWTVPQHNYFWLCPTHHDAIHLFIGHVIRGRDRPTQSVMRSIGDYELEELRALMEILDVFKEAYFGAS